MKTESFSYFTYEFKVQYTTGQKHFTPDQFHIAPVSDKLFITA